jgi:peptide/nickel transport system substrate-binding protein
MKHFSKSLFFGVALSALTLAATQLQAATPNNQLVIGTSLAQVLSLDPQQATEPKVLEILANLYDRLVATTPDGKILPQLADSWTIDDKSITFKLRDATFSSGNPVTAKDVVFSLTRLLKLNQSGSTYLKQAGYSAENIGQLVHAVDERTFRIDLSGKIIATDLLNRLALGVQVSSTASRFSNMPKTTTRATSG